MPALASMGGTPFPSVVQDAEIECGMQVKIVTYAPTEFYHCGHCEVVWQQVGVGQPIRAEQRRSALPADLQAEYAAIASWAGEAQRRYGERLELRIVDVASVEGVLTALRHRLRHFPAFVVDGSERIVGFDPERLDAALARRDASTTT
jgi:hypothetical protein